MVALMLLQEQKIYHCSTVSTLLSLNLNSITTFSKFKLQINSDCIEIFLVDT